MDRDTLLPKLDQAMRAERDGYEFYSSAAARSQDPGARTMFTRLADDERQHFIALQERARVIASGGEWVSGTLEQDAWDPASAAELFSPDFRERIALHHVEMSALSIGILLEKRSVEFYSQREQEAEDPEVRRFFHDLVVWETAHHEALLALDDQMKTEYWEANRFSPLL